MASETAQPSNSNQRHQMPKRSAISNTQRKGVLLGKSKSTKRALSDSLIPELSASEFCSKRRKQQKKEGGGIDSNEGGDFTDPTDSWAGPLTKPRHHFATASQLYAKSKEHLLRQKQLARQANTDKPKSKSKRNRQHVVANESLSENSSEIKRTTSSKKKQTVSEEKSATTAETDSSLLTLKLPRGRKQLDVESFLSPPAIGEDPAVAIGGPFTCTVCNAKFPACTSLVKHMKIHKRTLFSGKCQCGQKFQNSVTFLQHCLLNHPKAYYQKPSDIQDQSTSKGKNPKQFKCDVCGAVFIVAKTMEKHRMLHTQGFRCTVCSEIFTLPRDLKDHMNQHLRGNQMELRHPGYWASFKASSGSGNRASATEPKPRIKPVVKKLRKVPDEEHSETLLTDEEHSGTESACQGNKPELVCFTQTALGARPDEKKIIGFRCRGCSKVFRAMSDFLLHISAGSTDLVGPAAGPSYMLNMNTNGNMNSSVGTDRHNMMDSRNTDARDTDDTDDSDAVSDSFNAACSTNNRNTLNNSQELSSSQDGISLDMEQEKDTLGPESTSYKIFISKRMNENAHTIPYGVQVKMEPTADNVSGGESLVFQGMEQSSNSLDAPWAGGVKMEQSCPSYQVYLDTALDTEKEWANNGDLDDGSGGGVDLNRNSGSEIAEECNWDEGSKKVKIELNVNWSCDHESQEFENESNEIWQISVNSDEESVPLEEDSRATLVSTQSISMTELRECENESQAELWKVSVKSEEDTEALEQDSSPSHKFSSEDGNSTSYEQGQILTCGDGVLPGKSGYEIHTELLKQSDEPDKIVENETLDESEAAYSARLQTTGDAVFLGNQHPEEGTQQWVVTSDSPIIKQEPISQEEPMTNDRDIDMGDAQEAGPWDQNEDQNEPSLPTAFRSRNTTDAGVFPVHLFCNAQIVQSMQKEENK